MTNFRFGKIGALFAAAAALSSCAVNLPPPPVSNPADAHAPEAATAPLRPMLLATSRNFLSPATDDRNAAAQQMEMSQMKHGDSPASANVYYTCPMHPEIKETSPGECPICGMTLIKKSAAPKGATP